MADAFGWIILVLFFGSFILACAQMGRTASPPATDAAAPEPPSEGPRAAKLDDPSDGRTKALPILKDP